jgi:hypothetical protein
MSAATMVPKNQVLNWGTTMATLRCIPALCPIGIGAIT